MLAEGVGVDGEGKLRVLDIFICHVHFFVSSMKRIELVFFLNDFI